MTQVGRPAKPLAEHLLHGTYRHDRHGPLGSTVLDWPEKPPTRLIASARSQRRWLDLPPGRAANEHAVRSGCRFNERLAAHVVEFFRKFLRHSKGQWAGEPFDPLPWQIDEVLYPLFGWVRPDGNRRYRYSYIEMPKKQGKSTLASAIGLYMLCGDDEAGAEIYSLGADRDQARIVHNEAIAMTKASPELSAVLKINHTTGNIAYPATQSWYRALSGRPRGKHGLNAHCGIIDELHEWYGDEVWHSLKYAYRARKNPLQFVITNAGNDLQSVCYHQREKAEAILAGRASDDRFFALISAVPREDAEAEIEAVRGGAKELPVARRCNSSLGTITAEEDLLADIQDVLQTPSELPNLLRLTYGVWQVSALPWLRTDLWDACREDFSAEDLEKTECDAGLDMSKTEDMTALVLIFPDEHQEDVYRQLAFFWLPEETVAKHAHIIDYQPWIAGGWLRVTPGPVIDYAYLQRDLAEIAERYTIRRLAYDSAYAGQTSQWLEEECSIERVEFRQGMKSYMGPTAEYERLVIAGRLRHNGNPILDWQAGHVQVKVDENNNKRPVKPKQNDIRKIDGIIAGVMALDLAACRPEEGADEGSLWYANEV